MLTRQDTEQLLSYYHSPLADSKPLSPEIDSARHHRQPSVGSTSSSDYSTDSSLSEYSSKDQESSQTEASPPGFRRERAPSEGGSDRRRLAIVQMADATATERVSKALTDQTNSTSSIRSRRGIEGNMEGLALVAPPDAAPGSYTSLTPPPTAPATSVQKMQDHQDRGHSRSASEAVGKKSTSPRNVGIVGTTRPTVSPHQPPSILASLATDDTNLRPPIFIHPQTRSPSPAVSALSADSDVFFIKGTRPDPLVVTPGIGEGKRIDAPVAAPVVVNLSSNDSDSKQNMLAPSRAVSYLDYQPGKPFLQHK